MQAAPCTLEVGQHLLSAAGNSPSCVSIQEVVTVVDESLLVPRENGCRFLGIIWQPSPHQLVKVADATENTAVPQLDSGRHYHQGYALIGSHRLRLSA